MFRVGRVSVGSRGACGINAAGGGVALGSPSICRAMAMARATTDGDTFPQHVPVPGLPGARGMTRTFSFPFPFPGDTETLRHGDTREWERNGSGTGVCLLPCASYLVPPTLCLA